MDKLDFMTLTAKQLHDYMEEHATAEQKKAFKKAAFSSVKKKKAVVVLDDNGKPIMYQEKDKNGNLKYDENGKPIMRQKKRMVEIADSKETEQFCLLDGKWWFVENFSDAVKNVPQKAEKKEKASDLFANW